MILILDRKKTTVRYENNCLQIEREGEKMRRVPIKQLSQVVVYGNPLSEVSAWRQLALAHVPVAFLSTRGKPQAAMFASGLATQLPFRRLQHRCAENTVIAHQLACYFLTLKMQSYDLPLRTLQSDYSIKKEDLESFLLQRQKVMKKLEKADSIQSLMGMEGQLARAWFALLARYIPYRWKFAGRNRQPPRDPANSVLSLGYTLMLTEVHQLLLASGLDPSLGFLHQDTAGRSSLALDFSEIFRAGVDNFMLQWLNKKELDESSFYYREIEGCRLSKNTRPLFFGAWANYRYHWPRMLKTSPSEDNETQRNDENEKYPTADLKELVNGHIMQLRQVMKAYDIKQ